MLKLGTFLMVYRNKLSLFSNSIITCLKRILSFVYLHLVFENYHSESPVNQIIYLKH